MLLSLLNSIVADTLVLCPDCRKCSLRSSLFCAESDGGTGGDKVRLTTRSVRHSVALPICLRLLAAPAYSALL